MEHPLIPFEPVTVRHRHDGWTAERQIAFIEALAETACVDEACKRVGMSRRSVYALRRGPNAELFRKAWDAALDHAMNQLETAVVSRALHGVARPVFFRGEQVGEWREYDERLAMFLLRYRRPARFGGWIDGREPAYPVVEPIPTDNDFEPEDDSAGRLEFYCDEIAEKEACRPPETDPNGGEAEPETAPRAQGA